MDRLPVELLRAIRAPIVGLALAIAGWAIVAAVLAGQAAKPDGQFGIDFADYHAAAVRMAAGDSPYAPAMLDGPIPSQGTDRYRYPPPFAALLIPLAGLPLGTATVAWLAIQVATLGAALVLAAGRTGWSGLVWPAALAGWWFPVIDALLKGNVDGPITLAAAVLAVGAPAAGAVATSAGTVLKLTPVAGLVPLARRAPRSLAWAAVAAAILVVPTLVIWPQAWADYAVVLPNLVAGSADSPGGLAPAALLESSGGAASGLAPLVRWATLGLAAVAVVASWWLVGPKPGPAGSAGGPGTPDRRWLAAVLLTVVVGLIVPPAIWYHYLCVLLPFVVLAWPLADGRIRALLLLGVVLVDLGLVAIWIATVGATVVVLALLAVWIPRQADRVTGGSPAAA